MLSRKIFQIRQTTGYTRYYRSEATARYVAQLTEAAPDGLIILVSDHLPPLRKGINEYKRLVYGWRRRSQSPELSGSD